MDFRQTSLISLLDILEKKGVLTQEQTQMIRVRQGILVSLIRKEKMKNLQQRYTVSPVEIIMASGCSQADGAPLDEEKIVEIWAEASGVPYLRIDPLKLNSKLITESFSQNFAKLNVVLPISLENNVLTVATDYPKNDELIGALRVSQRYDIRCVLASKSSIYGVSQRFMGSGQV